MTSASFPAPARAATTVSPRGQFRCTVLANTPLCREHFRLVLALPSFPATQPGQFIQLSCRDVSDGDWHDRDVIWQPGQVTPLVGRELAAPQAFLRRPFSLAGRRDADGRIELDIIHRVVGVGTHWLASLRPGDDVDILGPLGNRFTLPPAGSTAVLVGGGVGIPPMLYLAEKLAVRNAVAFAGAVTKDLVPLTLLNAPSADDAAVPSMIVREFALHRIPSVITTDDGSFGFRGFVTQALERYLDHPDRHASSHPPVIYTCGPEPMMKRVAQIAAGRGLECQVAVERAMACGMGTCQSCCIRVRKPDPTKPPLVGRDWCYRLACTDGPVFRGADLLW